MDAASTRLNCGVCLAADLSLAARIIRALQDAPANGQTDLMQRVLGPNRTLDQCSQFNATLRFHLVHPIGVVEERIQVPGTGHAGPPVFEFRYRLPTAAEAEASRAVARAGRADFEIEEASD